MSIQSDDANSSGNFYIEPLHHGTAIVASAICESSHPSRFADMRDFWEWPNANRLPFSKIIKTKEWNEFYHCDSGVWVNAREHNNWVCAALHPNDDDGDVIFVACLRVLPRLTHKRRFNGHKTMWALCARTTQNARSNGFAKVNHTITRVCVCVSYPKWQTISSHVEAYSTGSHTVCPGTLKAKYHFYLSLFGSW